MTPSNFLILGYLKTFLQNVDTVSSSTTTAGIHIYEKLLVDDILIPMELYKNVIMCTVRYDAQDMICSIAYDTDSSTFTYFQRKGEKRITFSYDEADGLLDEATYFQRSLLTDFEFTYEEGCSIISTVLEVHEYFKQKYQITRQHSIND